MYCFPVYKWSWLCCFYISLKSPKLHSGRAVWSQVSCDKMKGTTATSSLNWLRRSVFQKALKKILKSISNKKKKKAFKTRNMSVIYLLPSILLEFSYLSGWPVGLESASAVQLWQIFFLWFPLLWFFQATSLATTI